MASFSWRISVMMHYSNHPEGATFITQTMRDLVNRYHQLADGNKNYYIPSPRLLDQSTLDFFAFVDLADCLLESTE